jgi:hypothetical protein
MELLIVFTGGVLIHISLENLNQVISEIHRVSNKYIMAMEYYAPEETVIPYRGHTALLWKRDFCKHYLDTFTDLSLVSTGYVDAPGFDRDTWWLFEKKNV